MKFHRVAPKNWNLPRLKKALTSMKSRRILVVGDLGLDRYTIGLVERISPEAPVPIVFVEDEQLKPGLAANVAANVDALGGKCVLVGAVGNDAVANDLKRLMKDIHVDSRSFVVDSTRRTVLKERIVSDRQQLLRVDYETSRAIPRKTESAILAEVERRIKSTDAVIVQDYAKGLVTDRLSSGVYRLSRKFGKFCLTDPNSKNSAQIYHGTDLLKPNRKEAEDLSGIRITGDKALAECGKRLMELTGARNVLITLGKDGMVAFERGSKSALWVGTLAREVYDVSGAGDTVISVLAMALAGGACVEDAVILGNIAAGIEVGKRGTATVSTREILQLIHSLN